MPDGTKTVICARCKAHVAEPAPGQTSRHPPKETEPGMHHLETCPVEIYGPPLPMDTLSYLSTDFS